MEEEVAPCPSQACPLPSCRHCPGGPRPRWTSGYPGRPCREEAQVTHARGHLDRDVLPRHRPRVTKRLDDGSLSSLVSHRTETGRQMAPGPSASGHRGGRTEAEAGCLLLPMLRAVPVTPHPGGAGDPQASGRLCVGGGTRSERARQALSQ
jgi:hypothetical protein